MLESFVEKPNLPQKSITACCVSSQKQDIILALNKLHIKTVLTAPDARLSPPVSSHSDMLIHHLGGCDIAVLDKFSACSANLTAKGFKLREVLNPPKAIYPDDVRLNALRIGNRAFAKFDSIDDVLISYYENNKIEMIDINQGYSKCSVFIVNENSVITADSATADVLADKNIDVLLIEKGGIDIDTYDYGFIGGCGGLISKDAAAFTGNVNLHQSGEKIKAFLNKKGVRLISLTPDKLYDIGGILPLIEA